MARGTKILDGFRNARDLNGFKFGKWTVLSFDRKDDKCGNVYWNVVCQCGTTASVAGSRLVAGGSTQCKSCAGRQSGRRGMYTRHSEGDLYVIRCGRYFKVGASKDVERRVRDLQASNPLKIELVYHGKDEACDEALWHAVFAHRHHRNEWFKA